MTASPAAEWISLFNQGEYIAALLSLETAWFQERDDFHKGLIRVCAGLNQLRLGLDSGPLFLLSTARDLLQPFQPHHNNLDLITLDRFLADCLVLLQATPNQPRQIPTFTIN